MPIKIPNDLPAVQTLADENTRLLGNTPLQIELTLIRTESYLSQNTAQEHLHLFL
jgi:homoserine O-succinyltransferase